MKNLIKTFLILIITMNSYAITNDHLSHWLSSELESHENILYVLERESTSSVWELNTVRVRLRATLSVEIPLLAKGKVRPEIELYYTK
ncbi:MAG: hypothetical protein K9K67_13925 [Bacteriovoracaceae bacterium]|nr:hypothetical protein [Bacteriovoracaceae bacterium]